MATKWFDTVNPDDSAGKNINVFLSDGYPNLYLEQFNFHFIYPQDSNQPLSSLAVTIPKAIPTADKSSSEV
ncbi:MAG: hypothetical protein LBR31_05000, partial [Desulfovibrio sp.]|nr:hypothetical protein [Desulfovibrio sp.]